MWQGEEMYVQTDRQKERDNHKNRQTDVCEDRQADNNTVELLFTESELCTSALYFPH